VRASTAGPLLAALGLLACRSPEAPPAGSDGSDDTEDTDYHVIVPEGFGDVAGRVCDPSGNAWVSGAEVWVEAGDGTLLTHTDGAGWFVLDDVPAGPQVLHVRSGSFFAEHDIDVAPDTRNELPEPACLGADNLDILVIDGPFDDVGSLLDELAIPYTQVPRDDARRMLTSVTRLREYDVVFVECGADVFWAHESPPVALRSWVRQGGSVYASDLAWPVVATVFPESVEMIAARPNLGEPGRLRATITQPWLREVLGRDGLDLQMDPSWAVLSMRSGGSPLMQGTARLHEGDPVRAPLAIRDEVDDGRLLYTSFHQHDLTDEDAERMLKAMLLSL